MSFDDHKRQKRRLQTLGVGGYVVMTDEAAKAGLSTRFPVGEIVGFDDDPIGVRVRKLGQSGVCRYAAGFWAPAPNRLINHLR